MTHEGWYAIKQRDQTKPNQTENMYTLGKGMNPIILLAMGLNSTTTVLQEEWLWL